MRKPLRLLFFALFALGALGFWPPSTDAQLETPTMGIEEIRPGMKGRGLTVFKGTEPEEFQFEVLDILWKREVGSNAIIIRMSGGPLEKTAIIAGMSGSPCYIDGKLIGAVSFGWHFESEPIAGVTPVEEMKYVFERGEKEETTALETKAYASPVLVMNNPVDDLRSLGAAHNSRGWAGPPSPIELKPIATPALVSGIPSPALHRLAKALAPYGIIPVQGGGAGKAKASLPSGRTFVPGSAIAIPLLWGDLTATANGTVTFVEGDRIAAFGHPMFNEGRVDVPMARCNIVTVIPSRQWSVKLGVALDSVGKIDTDLRAAISGRIGEEAKSIPCTVIVKTDGESKPREHHFFSIAHKNLTPALLASAAESSILEVEREKGDTTVEVEARIQIKGREKPFVFKNIYYEKTPSLNAASRLSTVVGGIMNNPFHKVDFESVELRVQVRNERKTARITRIEAEPLIGKPGEKVELTIWLRPYGKKDEEPQTVDLTIPDDVPPGTVLTVTACCASVSETLERQRGGGRFEVCNLDQLLAHFEKQERNNDLIVRTTVPFHGATVDGVEFPPLPAAILSVMANSNSPGVQLTNADMVQRIATKWILSGSQSITILVEP